METSKGLTIHFKELPDIIFINWKHNFDSEKNKKPQLFTENIFPVVIIL